MDNRIFNVNGRGDDMLLAALKLVFMQEGDNTTCAGWEYNSVKGLVLVWSTDDSREDVHPFPVPLTAEQCFPFVRAWLDSDQARMVQQKGWDAKTDHDGSNGDGWRVYCEDWGHVGENHYAICAIKPVVLWFGK
jgi:hypothetical protein